MLLSIQKHCNNYLKAENLLFSEWQNKNRSLWRMCGGQKGISQEQQPGEKMWVFNVLFN